MKWEHDWGFIKDMMSGAKNEIRLFERTEKADENQEYPSVKDAIADRVSLITVNGYLRILGTSESVYEDAAGFSALYKEIFKEEKRIIAYDVFGGLFAEKKGILGKIISYFAPDSLEWEKLGMDQQKFMDWAFNGDVHKFYESFLWDGYREILSKVSREEGIFVYPFFWAKECNIQTAFKKIVPFKDILETNYQNMLAINGAGDDA